MERNERTRQLLIMHVQKYPDLEIRDLLKFLHRKVSSANIRRFYKMSKI